MAARVAVHGVAHGAPCGVLHEAECAAAAPPPCPVTGEDPVVQAALVDLEPLEGVEFEATTPCYPEVHPEVPVGQ